MVYEALLTHATSDKTRFSRHALVGTHRCRSFQSVGRWPFPQSLISLSRSGRRIASRSHTRSQSFSLLSTCTSHHSTSHSPLTVVGWSTSQRHHAAPVHYTQQCACTLVPNKTRLIDFGICHYVTHDCRKRSDDVITQFVCMTFGLSWAAGSKVTRGTS